MKFETGQTMLRAFARALSIKSAFFILVHSFAVLRNMKQWTSPHDFHCNADVEQLLHDTINVNFVTSSRKQSKSPFYTRFLLLQKKTSFTEAIES